MAEPTEEMTTAFLERFDNEDEPVTFVESVDIEVAFYAGWKAKEAIGE